MYNDLILIILSIWVLIGCVIVLFNLKELSRLVNVEKSNLVRLMLIVYLVPIAMVYPFFIIYNKITN